MSNQYATYPIHSGGSGPTLPVSIANGGTGQTTASAALTALGGANTNLTNLTSPVAPNQQLGLLVGSAGTPSLSFQGDLTTGLYHSAASQVSLSIASTEQFRFGLDGFGGGFMFMPSELGGISVGMPLTAPANFNATIAAASSFYNATFAAIGAGGFSGNHYNIGSQGTIAAPTASLNGDRIGNYAIFGFAHTGIGANGYIQGGGMATFATQNWSASAAGAKITFQTIPNNSLTTTTVCTLDQNGDVIANTGNLDIATAGKGLRVKEGSNAKQGVATLAVGVVTVSNTSVTANSRIFLTAQSLGTVTTPQALAITSLVPGTSFTISSSSVIDTSVVAFEIFEPG